MPQKSRRSALLLLAALPALSCGLARVDADNPPGPLYGATGDPGTNSPTPASNSSFVRVSGDQLTLGGEPFKLKGVNYYPFDHNWDQMWGCRPDEPGCGHPFRPEVLGADFARARAIGINVVRVILQYTKFSQPQLSGAARGEPSATMLSRLDRVIELAAARGLRVMISLFDWTHIEAIPYEEAARHVRTLAARYRDDPRVVIWDLQNETDHRFWRPGCAGSRAQCIDTQLRATLHGRLRKLIGELKAVDTRHPVTVGLYGTFVAPGGERGAMAAGAQDAFTIDPVNLLDVLDVVCIHWYDEAGEQTERVLGEALATLKRATSKPIIVQEIGLPMAGRREDGSLVAGEQDPAFNERFYRAWIAAVERHDIAGAMPWVLLDFDPHTSYFQRGDDYCQLSFGLFDVGPGGDVYTLKPAGRLFRDELDWRDPAARSVRFLAQRNGCVGASLPTQSPHLDAEDAARLSRLYCTGLNRPPDAAGFDYWARKVAQGVTLQQVAASFLASPEYTSPWAELADRDFVKLLYTRALQRQPDQAGFDHWLGAVAQRGRAAMIAGVAESSELRALLSMPSE